MADAWNALLSLMTLTWITCNPQLTAEELAEIFNVSKSTIDDHLKSMG